MISEPRKLAMRISLLVSVLMLAGKLTAYALTHSTAMLADAAESVVHGAATGFAAFSLWYASRPADTAHPYGHGRIVYFSTGFEGALVLAASVAVVYTAVRGLIHGVELQRLGVGLILAGSLAAVNLVLGLMLVSVGRKLHALVLVANGKHVLSDFWTTAGAILGVGLVKLTGVVWLDPVAALLLAGWIMITGISLVRRAYAGLMDEVDPQMSDRLMQGLEGAIRKGLITDYHELRCREINDQFFIDVHLLIAGAVPIAEAHARATQVEESLGKLFPEDRVRIASHIEPAEHETAHPTGHEEQ